MRLTILMPCLNEEETLKASIQRAQMFYERNKNKFELFEILICDNGSTDASLAIANRMSYVRTITETKIGYGSTLITGIQQAKGDYVIFGDCDMSYDFADLDLFCQKLNEGYALVVGNRFACMEPNAMSLSHKIGVKILSALARYKYHSEIIDFHCGLRGLKKDSFLHAKCKCSGMEFATELISIFEKNHERVTNIPIHFYKDQRTGKSHLRTVQDGLRHLFYILSKGR